MDDKFQPATTGKLALFDAETQQDLLYHYREAVRARAHQWDHEGAIEHIIGTEIDYSTEDMGCDASCVHGPAEIADMSFLGLEELETYLESAPEEDIKEFLAKKENPDPKDAE